MGGALCDSLRAVGHFWPGGIDSGLNRLRRAVAICPPADAADWLHADYGAGGQPDAGVSENPPQSLSAGVYLPARKRRNGILYPQLGGEYSGQHGAGQTPESG